MNKNTLLVIAVVVLSTSAGILIGYEPPLKETPIPSWIPIIHQARLSDWGALDFVEQNLNGVEDGTGWVDVVSGIVHYDMGEDEWFTAALIHEASHVQQFKDGLQYYGSHAEVMADAVTRAFWNGWPQRHPDDVPDNGPVNGNPIVEKEK